LIVPTLNPMPEWPRLLDAIDAQTFALHRRVMVDSGSSDGACALARERGMQVVGISRDQFDHGGTRRWAVDEFAADCDIVLFLTQDAIPAEPESVEKLLAGFADSRVGAAYGRQLPRPDASPTEAHARLFNYPPEARYNDLGSIARRGIKAAFFSNSWGAYRLAALNDVGGIPASVICGEDTCVAGKMLRQGYTTAYVADALVWHSHNFTLVQEFRRYFDTGVLHTQEAWLLETFGAAGGEGRRFVMSELAYLRKHAPWRIPGALMRNASKLLAYRLGRHHQSLPGSLSRRLSVQPRRWRSRS